MKTRQFKTSAGSQYPLGSTVDDTGVNFSLLSPEAEYVELLLFSAHDDLHPISTIVLDPKVNKTFHFWHIHVEKATAGMHYAYRVNGPSAPHLRFNPSKVLIDPYSKANSKTLWNRGDACGPADNLATSIRSVIVDDSKYDWEGDKPLRRSMANSVIYEMHVGGFTRSPSSNVKHPGTFKGVIEKIPYLKELGVTAVELLPVFEFDNTEKRIVDGRELTNYWGYSTMAFFAPHPAYCVNPHIGHHVTEFRDMVKALHKAGIEVILDVVFNHTDEGNHQGPMFSFKGIANDVFYYLSPENKAFYYDFSGCGNTINTNHPIAEKFIVDCLRYWVKEMHVDGFRFDEASVLSRGENGAPLEHPPVLWHIELDDALINSKVIAEAWDAAGLYQVGHFPGARWADWNGKFRDHMRSFVRGDAGIVDGNSLVCQVASRICGSPDLYQWNHHLPVNSVNFINCHDGFTMNDLVCYNGKHNDANGEYNRDGIDNNISANYGYEGLSDDPNLEAFRDRQIKNFATLLLLSQGVPMISMGDEVRRTQGGNNNAYCQDNAISWFDWELTKKNAHLFRYWKWMIDFRKRHQAVHRGRYFTGERNARGVPDIAWHGTRVNSPDWSPQSRVLAYTLAGFDGEPEVHVMINMYWEPLTFEIPALPYPTAWLRAVDTGRSSPEDILEPGKEVPCTESTYELAGRSIVVLVSAPQ